MIFLSTCTVRFGKKVFQIAANQANGMLNSKFQNLGMEMRAANFHTYLEKKNKIMGQQQDNDAGNETLISVALSSLLS